MKAFVYAIPILLLLGSAVSAQPPQQINSNYQFKSVGADSGGIRIPIYTVLPSAPNANYVRHGALAYRTDESLWGWTGTAWTCLSCTAAGSATPGLPVQSIQFNSGPGQFRGSSHMTWDSVHFKINVDSAAIFKALVGTNALALQYPLEVNSQFGGYSGIRIRNYSTSGSASGQLRVEDAQGFGFEMNQLDATFGGNASVLRSHSPSALVVASDSCDQIYETGTPGVHIEVPIHIWYRNRQGTVVNRVTIGNTQGSGTYGDSAHNATLFVAGNSLMGAPVTNCDEGHFYAQWLAGDYRDLGYVEGVGHRWFTVNRTTEQFNAMALDSVGNLTLAGAMSVGQVPTIAIGPAVQFGVNSTTKGFLPPRMTTVQKLAIVSPPEGLEVYDLVLHQMSYFNGTIWINL